MERVIAAARELGCHLEINAQPDRVDLNDMHIHAAKASGRQACDLHRRAFGGRIRAAFGSASTRRGAVGSPRMT